MLKAANFDSFAYACPFFTTELWVNNGYGCRHPEQEEKCDDRDGNEGGCCYCWSCPIGIEADSEDLSNPDIDWDGLCSEDEVAESEYILVNISPDATEDEKAAWDSYERYLHRYDPDWKKQTDTNGISVR